MGKQRRADNAQELLNVVIDYSDFLKKVITGDESWVYGYEMKTKT